MAYNNCALYMLLYKQCHGFYCCSKRAVNARSVFQEHHLVFQVQQETVRFLLVRNCFLKRTLYCSRRSSSCYNCCRRRLWVSKRKNCLFFSNRLCIAADAADATTKEAEGDCEVLTCKELFFKPTLYCSSSSSSTSYNCSRRRP